MLLVDLTCAATAIEAVTGISGGASLIKAALNGSAESAAGGVEVDMNLTVLGQIVLFVVLWVVLKPVLFDPMLKLFEEREKRIDGAKLKARSIDGESVQAEKKYEAAITKVRAEAAADRDRVRAEGAKAEAELLAKVRVETAQTLEEGRARLA